MPMHSAQAEAPTGLAALRRARTLARLRQAGLSDGTLETLLPSWPGLVQDLAVRSRVEVGLTLADGGRRGA